MSGKARILVVDDYEFGLKSMAQVLSEGGYEVTPCQSGEEALELVEKTTFDLALVGIRMEDMDGFGVLKGIKKAAPETMVVMLTGYASIASAVEAMSQGGYDCLVKPRASEELKLRVARALEKGVTEEALWESEEKLRAQYKGIPIPTYTWQRVGEDFVLVDYNDAAEAITHGKVVDFVGRTASEMYRDRPDILEELSQCLTEKTSIKREMGYRLDTTGENKRLAVNYVFVPPDLVMVHAEDITERKRTEEALKESEEKYRTLVNEINDGFVITDNRATITFANRALAKILGFESPDELVGRTFLEFLAPEVRDESEKGVRRSIEVEKLPEIVEDPFIRKDGSIGFIELKSTLIIEDGRVVGTRGVARDITERKRAEEEVQRHLDRLAALREIDRAISSTLDSSEVLDIILEQLERVIPYHSAAIFLLSDDIAKVTAGRGFPDVERAMGVAFSVEEDVLFHQIMESKRPLVLVDAQADERFQARGGTEYVRSWIGVPLIVRGEAIGFLTIDHREPGVYDEKSTEMALAFASQAAIAIENVQAYERLKTQNLETISALAAAMEMKDPYTSGHSQKVTEYATAIAQKMGLFPEEIENLRMAGLLHDIGKIGIPSTVLNKPAPLTSAEFLMIRAHPVITAEIVERVETLVAIVPIIRHHHERYDGKGYPDGLKGEEIPLLARILAVADGFEAMTSDRPYRPGMSTQEALAALQEGAGKQWDATIVKVFCRIPNQGRIP